MVSHTVRQAQVVNYKVKVVSTRFLFQARILCQFWNCKYAQVFKSNIKISLQKIIRNDQKNTEIVIKWFSNDIKILIY